jgi:hypothetical protein
MLKFLILFSTGLSGGCILRFGGELQIVEFAAVESPSLSVFEVA